MLDRCISTELMPTLWRSLPSQAMLPLGGAEFYGADRLQPALPDSRRQYARLNNRVPAILKLNDSHHAIYIRDASRLGMGLYSPVQLFPLSEVRIWLPDQEPLKMRVRRCLKQQRNCYQVGVQFTEGPLAAGLFRKLFMSTVGRKN
ncbi:PilZ domain-containing protein [Adhaeretor mobilis]|uniref:PilZ domain protein n=1 Tax=Adhaeretor mobilis TaxID=1930276 RepID=A0A517N0I6_9BACT|nr:PilZ domain-containing protein [Adhaeretor mobilis]QDT00651.1 PilZ domain protein [Adhaeretor mobilis]